MCISELHIRIKIHRLNLYRFLQPLHPNLRYAFNMYVANSEDEGLDWGPRWKRGLHGSNNNPNNDLARDTEK